MTNSYRPCAIFTLNNAAVKVTVIGSLLSTFNLKDFLSIHLGDNKICNYLQFCICESWASVLKDLLVVLAEFL